MKIFSVVLVALATLLWTHGRLEASDAGASTTEKPLIELTSPDAIKQIKPNFGEPVFAIAGSAITVQLPAAKGNYAGIQVYPPAGVSAWDLTPYGHIEAKISNTGTTVIRFNIVLRGISSGAPAQDAEIVAIKPGESKVVKCFFGYAWGFKPGPVLDPASINQVLFFVAKSTVDQSFTVENLQAAGTAGEKPPFNPDNVVNNPPKGVILGAGATFDVAKQVVANGTQVSADANGANAVNFAGGKQETIKIRPAMGVWNLTQANQIRVRFKNVGDTPATPSVTLAANTVAASSPIAPGSEAEITVSFVPAISTVLNTDYTQHVTPGTGTKLESEKVKEFSIASDMTPGAKHLLITSIVADAVTDAVTGWLGKKPPVEGDWTQTFDEEFDGPSIDLTKWNIYGHNFWDKRTHFSKDNLIFKDGKVLFHYEKKSGFHNDDPNDKEIGKTDYAGGFLNTWGKFTQRYGYFESRMKLPTAPDLWPAFWLMPDRGRTSYTGHYRVGTAFQPGVDPGNGGMEFDIMEFLSGWGPYRYNVAMLWDGYGRIGKQTGSTMNYIRPDKDGYITSGLLWTPGSAIYYCNGKEILRWENPRISDEQEYIMYDMVTGGWDHTLPQLDDTKLPDDFVIDYCRVWQRKDLATSGDGPKPNKGDPSETKN